MGVRIRVRMGDSAGIPGFVLPRLKPRTNKSTGQEPPQDCGAEGRSTQERNPSQDGAQGARAGEGARPQHAPVCPSFASLHLPGGAWS